MNISNEPYIYFPREKWAALRNSEPLTLTEEELAELKGINDEISMDEVREIYLPLSRLLNYYVSAGVNRRTVLMRFLKQKTQKIPFVIGIAGSVSAGKSTIARVMQTLLSRWKECTDVDLVATDGFLYPNAVLEKKGLTAKKGFPASYDTKKLLQFVIDVKSGKTEVRAPVYSHLIYDVVPDKYQIVNRPDILILEGLNVLQSSVDYKNDKPGLFVSDFIDFSIYVDTDEKLLEKWFISRFLKFRQGAFTDPESFFHEFSKIDEEEAVRTAKNVWREINLKNLSENILPTRERATLILHKSENHFVDYVKLRK